MWQGKKTRKWKLKMQNDSGFFLKQKAGVCPQAEFANPSAGSQKATEAGSCWQLRRTCAARETCGVCARPDSTPLHPGPSPAGRLRWDPEEERHRLPRQSTWHSQETRAGVAEAPCFFQRQVLKAGTGWHCCAPDGRSGGASGRGQGGGTGAQFCSARSGVAWRSGPRSDAASRVRVKDPESGESNRARPNLDPCSHAPAGRVAEKTRRDAPPALHGPHCACAERPRWGFVISFRRQSPLKCEGKGLTWGPPMSLLHRSSSGPPPSPHKFPARGLCPSATSLATQPNTRIPKRA